MEANERGTALEGINIIPRGNNVLIKMSFNESVMAIHSNKPTKENDEYVTFTVVAIGPLVKDLKLGEEVLFTIPRDGYTDVPIKGNLRGIRELHKFYTKLSRQEYTELLAGGDSKVDVHQYGMFPEYLVTGHIL